MSCLAGKTALSIALAVLSPEIQSQNDLSAPEDATSLSKTAKDCSSDYRQCADEWEFKRSSHLYFVGREACKEAATKEARGHAEDGHRGMTGVIRFGPDPFEQLAYYDWPGMMADLGIVMKDEEMSLQVYGSGWAEGRSVCLFDFDSERVESISVGFDRLVVVPM